MDSKVILVRGEPFKATKKALRLVNFKRCVKNKEKIVIKPNLCLALPSWMGITTDVEVVRGILEMLPHPEQAVVVEGASEATKAFEVNRYHELTKEYGTKLVDLNRGSFKVVFVHRHFRLKRIKVSESALNSDFIISVGKLKPHSVAMTTGTLKNMMGVCPKDERLKIHAWLPWSLLDLLSVIHPNFGVIDGVIANEYNEGDPHPIKMGIILAGTDCVAVDAIASWIMGIHPQEVPYLNGAARMGLGENNLKHIRLEGDRPFRRIFRRSGLNFRSHVIQKMFIPFLLKSKLFGPSWRYFGKLSSVRSLEKIMKFLFVGRSIDRWTKKHLL